jgi:hypothetical protein
MFDDDFFGGYFGDYFGPVGLDAPVLFPREILVRSASVDYLLKDRAKITIEENVSVASVLAFRAVSVMIGAELMTTKTRNVTTVTTTKNVSEYQ